MLGSGRLPGRPPRRPPRQRLLARPAPRRHPARDPRQPRLGRGHDHDAPCRSTPASPKLRFEHRQRPRSPSSARTRPTSPPSCTSGRTATTRPRPSSCADETTALEDDRGRRQPGDRASTTPSAGTQRATLVAARAEAPARRGSQPSRGKLEIVSDVAAVELAESRGEADVREITGRVDGHASRRRAHRADVGALKLNTRGSTVRARTDSRARRVDAGAGRRAARPATRGPDRDRARTARRSTLEDLDDDRRRSASTPPAAA